MFSSWNYIENAFLRVQLVMPIQFESLSPWSPTHPCTYNKRNRLSGAPKKTWRAQTAAYATKPPATASASSLPATAQKALGPRQMRTSKQASWPPTARATLACEATVGTCDWREKECNCDLKHMCAHTSCVPWYVSIRHENNSTRLHVEFFICSFSLWAWHHCDPNFYYFVFCDCTGIWTPSATVQWHWELAT